MQLLTSLCFLLLASVAISTDLKLNQLHATYKLHQAAARTAHANHVDAVMNKPEDKNLHSILDKASEKAAALATASFKEYMAHAATQDGAISHTVVQKDGKFLVKHQADQKSIGRRLLQHGNDHGHGDHDDDDDNDHDACRQYRPQCDSSHACCEMFQNASRTVNAAVRLYGTALQQNCQQWKDALTLGLTDGDVTLNALVATVMEPAIIGTISPEFTTRGSFIIASYFNLACAPGGSRVVSETFNQVLALGNRVLFHMYFNLSSATSFRLLEHVGEARVNLGATSVGDRVCGFDVSFTRLGFGLSDAILPAIANFPATLTSQNNTIVSRCATILSFCPPGPATNFASATDCYNYFAALPNGGWDYADQKNRGCAFTLHFQMVPIRPDRHCPHVGPTGGGFCVAHANNDNVLQRDNVWGACHA